MTLNYDFVQLFISHTTVILQTNDYTVTKQDFELKIPIFHISKIEDSYSKLIILENMLSGWVRKKKQMEKIEYIGPMKWKCHLFNWWNLFCWFNDVGSVLKPKPISGIYNMDLFFILLRFFRSRTHLVCLVLNLFLCTANEHGLRCGKIFKTFTHWIEIPNSRSLNHWTSVLFRIYNDELHSAHTHRHTIKYSFDINLFCSVSNIETIKLRIPALRMT